ncbi:methanogenesis marker 8 protein [Methanolobus bombayensis]|uniref:methanogenesis marker 8 protein n=1 Tax=Methanolobus bombayensis TaxID=38023 RepID=UPI001AE9C7D4|nr:methanogenesis marker 8 protein [Methanolobus bombayensis]MBP1908348.1 putative methanogenesis marker protein 8 [Methanolobus bombayensis]
MAHVMEILGKARVVVEDGKVTEVGEPLIGWCPIFDKARGITEITKDEIRKNMEFRIKDFGLFTNKRQLDMDIFVGFGASETMMTGLNRGLLDTTVTACDGAGTVISNNPNLVQGMGARISGLVETEPIDETINGINERGGIVLDPSNANIDPVAGARKAAQLGYKKIAVTVVFPETAKELRKLEKELDLELVIIGAHVTGIDRQMAQDLLDSADIVTSCASKHVRELVKPLVQVGSSVPLFGLTQRGKELLLERAKEVESPLFVSSSKLPSLPEKKQPKKLV